MTHLDLTDLVALAAEVSEVEMPKVLELLDTAEVGAVLVEARPPRPAHEAAATLLTGLSAIAPLPAGNRRLALLAALHLLAINGLEATLDPPAVDELFAAGGDAAGLLDGRVTARDPLEGELRRLLAPDSQQAIGLALQRARRHRRRLVNPSDLLLGVFRQGGAGARALGNQAGAVDVVTFPPQSLLPERRAFEPDVCKALELALRAAVTMGHPEITTGHLLLGLLDGGHAGELPDNLDPAGVRPRVLDLLGPSADDEDRVARLADRLRRTDPAVAAELDDLADLQRAGLDRLIDMVRAWGGDLFLEALAKDTTIADVVGRHRLAAAPADPDPRHEELAKYLSSVAKYPRLSRAEEMELAQSTRTDARRRLIESHLELVVRIARRYEGQGLPLLDLIQEGNLALMRAVEHYDPTKGYRLSTFATWWVRQAITKAIADSRR